MKSILSYVIVGLASYVS